MSYEGIGWPLAALLVRAWVLMFLVDLAAQWIRKAVRSS